MNERMQRQYRASPDEPEETTEGSTDTAGLCFAAAALCAFLAAAVIVYRTGNSDSGPIVAARDSAPPVAAPSR
ncbi:MAG TPA: hypothetical protein VGJ20_07755 [Xanthobacteraceae bacterium]|jgi:hypothetical protein